MGTFIADLVLQLLSFIVEAERNNIKMRQREGISATKLKGVKFGRPPKPLPEEFQSLYELWNEGGITKSEAVKKCGMPLSTFWYEKSTISPESYDICVASTL